MDNCYVTCFHSAKGGTGKTFLLFQTVCAMAAKNEYSNTLFILLDCTISYDLSRMMTTREPNEEVHDLIQTLSNFGLDENNTTGE